MGPLQPICGDRELNLRHAALLWEALNGCIETGMHKLFSVAKLDCFSKSKLFLKSLYTWPSVSAMKKNVLFCSIIPNSGQTSSKVTPPLLNSHTVAQTILLFMKVFYDVISDAIVYIGMCT